MGELRQAPSIERVIDLGILGRFGIEAVATCRRGPRRELDEAADICEHVQAGDPAVAILPVPEKAPPAFTVAMTGSQQRSRCGRDR
jgi:hypothetical protein